MGGADRRGLMKGRGEIGVRKCSDVGRPGK